AEFQQSELQTPVFDLRLGQQAPEEQSAISSDSPLRSESVNFSFLKLEFKLNCEVYVDEIRTTFEVYIAKP
ncbi:hypothetical protein LINPERHAP1_LOCUS16618, partial [Linum perenne]